jgi:rfaE bifunctional protein nucleotidyltransferase chain/domain
MTPLAISKKVLALADVRAWRNSVAKSKDAVAVVAGSFDIFQPGNLALIRAAAQDSSRVCVVVDADKHRQNRGWAWNSAEVRTESIAHLRDASAVVCLSANHAQTALNELRPYRFVDCDAQSTNTPLHQSIRILADSIVSFPPLTGCFTRDISDRILRNATPVPVDPKMCLPLPTPADIDQLLQKRNGRILVTVNGCFDILHLGHLRMLSLARQMGTDLVVLINDDASVRAYKGPTRPVFPTIFRLTALNMLHSVCLAYAFTGDNPLSLIERIRPDIHVKGGTFEEERVRQERELLESWGGQVKLCPLVDGYSTTEIINRTRT